MSRRLALALPLLLGTVAVLPAHASYTGYGVSCGLASAGTTTQFGVIAAGPVIMPPITSGTVTSLTVTCRVQVGHADYDGTGPEVMTTFDGYVGGLAERTVTYQVPAGAKVYLCMTIAWDGTEGAETANVDYSDEPGEQCYWAHEVPGRPGPTLAYFVPAQPVFIDG